MRDLSDEFKLSFRSIPEVYEAFGGMVARTATDRAIRFRDGKKPHRAAVLNALVLFAAGLPAAEQKRVIREGMGRLNALLADGEPGAEAEATPDGRASGAVGREIDPETGRERPKGKDKGARKGKAG